MKKKELKSLMKTVKKEIRKDIRLNLVSSLTESAAKFNQDTAKFNKVIRKSSKKFSKEFSKKLVIDSLTLPDINLQFKDDQLSEISGRTNSSKAPVARNNTTASGSGIKSKRTTPVEKRTRVQKDPTLAEV